MRAARPAGLPAALPDGAAPADPSGARPRARAAARRPRAEPVRCEPGAGGRRAAAAGSCRDGGAGSERGGGFGGGRVPRAARPVPRAASPFPPQGAPRTGPRRRRHRDSGVRRRHRANSLPAGGVSGDCSGAHLIAAATRPQPASHHVLPSVVATCPAHTQAPQPSVVVQSLDVHGLLPAQFPPGTETLHDLCLGLPSSSIPHLLQLLGELLLVSLHRIPVTGISSRSQHSGHLENNNLPVC